MDDDIILYYVIGLIGNESLFSGTFKAIECHLISNQHSIYWEGKDGERERFFKENFSFEFQVYFVVFPLADIGLPQGQMLRHV